MNYRVTEHYARGNELFIAEFDQLNDANIFLTKKVLLDEADHKKIMYRLYHDTQLIRVSNKENIATTYAQYAEEDADITMTSALQFSVTTQIQNAPQHKIASFNQQNDAEAFIVGKCQLDDSIKDNDRFCVLKEQAVIQTLNKIIITNQLIKSDITSQGNQSTATFRPTPLPTRPTPPGGPSDCWVEKNEEDDKKEQD